MNFHKARISNPHFFHDDLVALNPELVPGEILYVKILVNSREVTRRKVGPPAIYTGSRRYLDLPFIEDGLWENTVPVANPIGDASGNLAGLYDREIIDLMLNPYQASVVSNPTNNAGGSFTTTWTREIGTSLASPVAVRYSVSNQQNLLGSTPILITASGRFTNEGVFPVGDVLLSHNGIAPSVVDEITINISATHQRGTSAVARTYINFYPKIMWVVSPTQVTNGTQFMALANRQNVISKNFKRDYSFLSGGFHLIAIPSMLNPSNLVYTDVTDPNRPAGIQITDLGTISINNGVATYNYRLLSTTFNLFTAHVIRIS